MDCTVVQVGGTEDHVHILCIQNKTMNVSDLVKKIKTDTSKWIKTKPSVPNDFHWQSGYAAFSVSQSDVEKVAIYIRNQVKHHETMTFQDELRTLLNRYEIDFDEKYLWD
jgi:REP element-mobilizing transposase RayT